MPTGAFGPCRHGDYCANREVCPDQDCSVSQLENCGLSKATVDGLNKRGIFALFPIQKGVFDPVMEGRDIIARARTGSGKTLAFALPVIESLVEVSEYWPFFHALQC